MRFGHWPLPENIREAAASSSSLNECGENGHYVFIGKFHYPVVPPKLKGWNHLYGIPAWKLFWSLTLFSSSFSSALGLGIEFLIFWRVPTDPSALSRSSSSFNIRTSPIPLLISSLPHFPSASNDFHTFSSSPIVIWEGKPVNNLSRITRFPLQFLINHLFSIGLLIRSPPRFLNSPGVAETGEESEFYGSNAYSIQRVPILISFD